VLSVRRSLKPQESASTSNNYLSQKRRPQGLRFLVFVDEQNAIGIHVLHSVRTWYTSKRNTTAKHRRISFVQNKRKAPVQGLFAGG
jgi:hypothetical protein